MNTCFISNNLDICETLNMHALGVLFYKASFTPHLENSGSTLALLLCVLFLPNRKDFSSCMF